MFRKQLWLICNVLLICYSCKQIAREKENKIRGKAAKVIVEKEEKLPEEPLTTDSYYENDSLAYELLNELENLKSDVKFRIEKKLVNNKYIVGLIDTIETRRYKNTSITSYKTKDKTILYKARIVDSIFSLSNKLSIGSKVYIIEKSIACRIRSNDFEFGNLERTVVFGLKFKEGILQSITYNGYVD